MSYVNTGQKRATWFTVNKTQGGVSISGYPKFYDLGANYNGPTNGPPELRTSKTTEELQKMSSTDYEFRSVIISSHVGGSIENIINFDATFTNQSVVTDTDTCPLPLP